uniref:nuclear receptor subfamily 0 group B member 2-like n=1 Tax=Oncorhynchus gorbuscha TaxID=8017 RepID=UPI001EAE9B50|nr:nuclear receptor subfamily 0 group B member 2-like [Oncorhynchus gorbuscha]
MMFPLEEMKTTCHCSGYREQQHQPHTILYNILSRADSNYNNNSLNNNNHVNPYDYNMIMPHNCHCERRRAVCLKNPEGTCQVASDVLVKTIRFMKSLPSFSQLPVEDQLSLLRDCWVPLFSLGLAQERTVFEVMDVPQASMLRRILLNSQGPQSEEEQEEEDEGKRSLPMLAGVHKLRSCLNRLWTLNLSPKEYAYLKGAMLFNPDVPGLSTTVFINSLQQEAQRALQEVVLTLHPGNSGRLSHILLSTSALHAVSESLITELFFRPVIGQANLYDLLSEMLFMRQEYS